MTFRGHNPDWIIFDEASSIPDDFWDRYNQHTYETKEYLTVRNITTHYTKPGSRVTACRVYIYKGPDSAFPNLNSTNIPGHVTCNKCTESAVYCEDVAKAEHEKERANWRMYKAKRDREAEEIRAENEAYSRKLAKEAHERAKAVHEAAVEATIQETLERALASKQRREVEAARALDVAQEIATQGSVKLTLTTADKLDLRSAIGMAETRPKVYVSSALKERWRALREKLR